MSTTKRWALLATTLATLLAAPAPALELTLFFGQPDGGELGEFGYQVRSAGDLNGDGLVDLVAGAPFDDALGLNAGRAFVWFGGPGMTGEPNLILDDAISGDYFGFAVAGIGDVDGDGFDDLAVGAPGFDSNGSKRGRVFVYRGGMNMDAVSDLQLDGENGGDRFGWSIAPAGDMDRDGTDDFVVGAPYNSLDGTNVGRAYLFVGESSMAAIGPAADVVWRGENGGGPLNSSNFADFAPDGLAIGGPGFGFSVASAHDFRGDGRAAVVVGAPGAFGAQGRAYLFFAASTAGQLPSTSPAVTMTNNVANEEFGWAVSSGGYLNSGSQSDVLVGAPGTNGNTGSVHVYYGAASPPATIATANLERTVGIAGDRFGFAVANAGDAEGTGNSWLVGAPREDSAGLSAGRVYLYQGTSATPTDLGPTAGGTAPVAEDQWGFSVAGLLGDLDGDGKDDFLVGAPTANARDNAVRGAMTLVSSGSRIVATPALRLDTVQRDGRYVEIGFAASHVAVFDDARLLSGGREIARLGAGLWPDARGLVAKVELGAIEDSSVELNWTTDGLTSGATFLLPDLRAREAMLLPPVPNPFNPRTTLSVELPRSGSVRLRIVDLRGRTVRDLFSGELPAGVTPIDFDGTDDAGRGLSSGSYVAVLEADGRRSTRRLTLVQ